MRRSAGVDVVSLETIRTFASHSHLRRCIGWSQCSLVGKSLPSHIDKEKTWGLFWLFDVKCVRSFDDCVCYSVTRSFEAFGFCTDSFVRIFRCACGTGRQHSNWTPTATLNRRAPTIERMDKIYWPNETNAKTHRRQNFFFARSGFISHCTAAFVLTLKSFKHTFVRLFAEATVRNLDNGVRRTSASDGYLKWTSNLCQVYDLSLHIRWTGGLHDFGFSRSKVRREHSTRKLNAMLLFRGVSFSKKKSMIHECKIRVLLRLRARNKWYH